MDFTEALSFSGENGPIIIHLYDNLGCKLLVKFESISSVYQASFKILFAEGFWMDHTMDLC